MLQMLPSDDRVIAMRVGGQLTRSELSVLLDKLEGRLAKPEPVHLYIEVDDFKGFELEGLPDYLRRAAGMLGKLKHFGRVALVSDQPWLRGAARLESALLPYVRYEVFRSSERDRALAWVRGDRELPRDPSFKLIETNRPDVIGFEIDGKLSAAELAAAADYFGERLAERRPLRVLGRIKRFGGLEPAGLVDSDFISMKRAALDGVEKYAVVGGPAWLPVWLRAVAPLTKIDVRHFDDEARAWEWLGATPTSERRLIGARDRAANKDKAEVQPQER
jgi:hypothetical protein